MSAKRRGPDFFEAEKFLQSLGGLIDALPSEANRKQVVSQLETLIGFLSQLKARMESIPTRQDATAVRVAIEGLTALFLEAKSNPALATMIGIKATTVRAKTPTITSEEIARAKSALASFESVSIDEIRTTLENMSAPELKAIGDALGVRAGGRAARETVVHQIATKITNTRGYRSLRDGTN